MMISNAGISVWGIVWIMTNCRFMNGRPDKGKGLSITGHEGPEGSKVK
jgi:hypothetical protein